MRRARRALAAAAAALLAAAGSGSVAAHDSYGPAGNTPRLWVQRLHLGSGTPATGPSVGHERAWAVTEASQHVPNTLPGHPTAATIWPREVAVGCDVDAQGRWWCDGYDVHPALGRGEYIYVRPVRREPAELPPAVVNVTCPCCTPAAPPPAPPRTRKKPLE